MDRDDEDRDNTSETPPDPAVLLRQTQTLMETMSQASTRRRTSDGWQPFVAKVLAGTGVAGVFAYMLLQFMLGTWADQQSKILTTSTAVLQAQERANVEMHEYVVQENVYRETMLFILRQTCRNVVTGYDQRATEAREKCDALAPHPNGVVR